MPTKFSWHGYSPASLPQVPSWVETLGRFGHIAKGVVYFIMGFLAFKLAIGAGGETAGARDAIREIGQQPYGRVLLGLTAIGLLGYTAWRWVQAGKDTEGVGTDAKGLVKRTGYAISGGSYLLLGCFAGSLALGMGGGGQSGGNGPSFLMDSTGGRVLLGIIAAIVIGTGIYFIIKGYKAKFMEKYNLAEMSNRFRQLAFHAGRTGLITRGVAVIIIGGFFLSAAWSGTRGGEIGGMGDALATIASQPYGKILIGITGFGLMAYAVHMILMGVYRRFNVNKG
ncbi:DUF1206 domain-containing protein [Roseiconus nitratireducens]|uniref:DUF1206 domain-containing protein n=1 Tax=Roseiconus nitratireducens TaxID=2605748 RepID=A0A5M6DBR4_9BACT|nr:DUF1206 domain-containing protein [Roseiconus nitratireducens]KAA5542595.1 DUF1206 domain-containing protein [Roseiconus nitratireducens]